MSKELNIDCVIGIDPGANGGIAIYIPNTPIKTVKMPKDIRDLRDLLQYYADTYKPIIFIEKVSMRTDDIDMSQGYKKKAMGKLFRIQNMMANYEHLKAIIEACDIPYVMVHPQKWQSKLNLRLKGVKEEKADRKNRYKEKASELYGVKATLWNADAILICHFGRWALVNDLDWVLKNLPQREQYKLF